MGTNNYYSELENRAAVLFERGIDPIFVLDAEGNLIDANPAALRFLEVDTIEAVKGRPVVKGVHWHKPERAPYSDPIPLSEDHEIINVNGREKILRVSVIPLIDGAIPVYYCIGHDLTEINALAKRLNSSLEKFRALLNSAPDGILQLSSQYEILDCNPSAENLLCCTAEQLIGHSLDALIEPADRPRLLDTLGSTRSSPFNLHTLQVQSSQLFEDEYRIIRFDGEQIIAQISIGQVNPITEHEAAFMVSVKDVTSRKRFEGQVNYLAYHDQLTGLYNRHFLLSSIDQAIAASKRNGHNLGVLVIDVDNFKKVNDTYGHAKGDDVLKQIAGLIKDACRESDIVGRYGGDEFIVCMPQTEELEPAVNRINTAFHEWYSVSGITTGLSITIGGAIHLPGNTKEATIHLADANMYIQKNSSMPPKPL
jgi:diguanylate cyclase (GGDEF)-like protein/PAS domain S-box-containing protein